METDNDHPLAEFVRNLPHEPGIYKYIDAEGVIIYVGKAKNLRNRVSSYFLKSNQHSLKTRRLVQEIHRIEYALVNSEMDALLLENNLIKEQQPKYNILLKDDKTYPYICITAEAFPRVMPIRSLDRTQGTYFGPYSSVKAMNTMLEMFRNLFTIRTCTFALTEKNIEAGKFKACLEFHIKKCKAPCEGLQKEEEYDLEIQQIKHILKGKIGIAKSYLKNKMQEAADNWAFEEAQQWKQKIDSLDHFQAKSLVANPNVTDLDVFTIHSDEKTAFYNYMHIENGCITRIKTSLVKKKLDEADATILRYILLEYIPNLSFTHRIISNIEPDFDLSQFNISVPKIGDMRGLIELSLKNALYLQKEKMEQAEEYKENSTGIRMMETLQKDLNLLKLPKHIECFDNSNLQGTNPVSSMVCFKDGRPAKKEYRHFNVKTVVGANDFATMYEVVQRRYKRLKEENQPLPDLIVIDGGKGQLSSAVQALKDLGMYGLMPIVGIAKRLEEIYFPLDELPVHIHKKSEGLILIQRIRDEAHRFAITFHRQKRSQKTLESQLESIEGIGEKTIQRVLEKYKSVANIRKADPKELEEILGKHKAELLHQALFQKDTND
jgi:excinuclease ABC subunit C